MVDVSRLEEPTSQPQFPVKKLTRHETDESSEGPIMFEAAASTEGTTMTTKKVVERRQRRRVDSDVEEEETPVQFQETVLEELVKQSRATEAKPMEKPKSTPAQKPERADSANVAEESEVTPEKNRFR